MEVEHDQNYILFHFYDTEKKKSEIKAKFPYIKDSYLVDHIVKKYYILLWQMKFETTIIKNSNQIYFFHFPIKKLNRWGKYQERVLVITDKVNIF